MVKLGFGRNVAESLLDLSRTGAQLVLTDRFKPGEKTRLRITIPRLGEVLVVDGVVRWCRSAASPPDGRWRVGFIFEEINEKAKGVLNGLNLWFDQGV